MPSANFALVLSGGGTSGVAWQAGLLRGLRDSGVDLTAPALLVGTSAGAVVGARVAAGQDVAAIYEEQLAPVAAGPGRDAGVLRQAIASLRGGARDGGLPQLTSAQLRTLGAMAIQASTESEQARLATVRRYLAGVEEWPERELFITAVDVLTGELVVWRKSSGVSIVEAVASSCAAPLIAPPTTIGGRRYMDAGPLSGTSAHLAAGHALVVVLAVAPDGPLGALDAEIARLAVQGSRVEVVRPNVSASAAIFPNPLDLTKRRGAALAGYEQGQQLAGAAAQWFVSSS